MLEVGLETQTARELTPWPFDCVVAGGRYITAEPAESQAKPPSPERDTASSREEVKDADKE